MTSLLTRIKCLAIAFMCTSLICLPDRGVGQEGEPLVLSLEDLLNLVREYHPVARQAALQIQRGEAGLRMAKGGFDPKLYTAIDQKYYNDKSYFSHLEGGLKVPTWFGVEFKAGFDQQSGEFLNPENTTPTGGLVMAGLQIPVGQGLLIDQRRSALFAARVYQKATEAERRMMLNDLLFDVSTSYWDWVLTEYNLRILREARDLAMSRMEFVRGSFSLGAKAAIDTVEAFIQVQLLDQQLQEALVENNAIQMELSNYLWSDASIPLELKETTLPPDSLQWLVAPRLSADTVELWISRLALDHPDLQRAALKLSALEIDRRLKADKLKPRLNLQYNFLTEPVGDAFLSQISPSNYKWGLEFEMPIFLRKERGDLQLSKVKLEEARLVRDQKLLEWRNKVRTYAYAQENLQGQIQLAERTVQNVRQLLVAERNRFENGESSLFLLNMRQQKLIESEMKWMALKTKQQQTGLALRWALGIGWQ
ncbi:MAG: TolC family protein [Saprospiraceae bacterium]|nr:TolC family protein [Saprospiraceae bacterium]